MWKKLKQNTILSENCLGMAGKNLLMAFLINLFIVGVGRAAPQIDIELLATDLYRPLSVTNAGDGSDRLFITNLIGQILIYDGAQILETPFLDIRALVYISSETGIASMAFHPDYQNNGYFYINYCNLDGDSVIARYSVSNDPNIADPNSASIIITIPQPGLQHNIDQLHFGPDGYLYASVGDGGIQSDPDHYAQNLNTLLGKILRIDVDGGTPYAIPPDNPFIGVADALDEIWAYGLRNPWRFSFDRLNGDIFIGDVGYGTWEEIDFQAAASDGGENYGWPLMEGNNCFDPSTNCNDGSLTLPLFEFEQTDDRCAVIGGYRYRGNRYGDLYGVYLYADLCTGTLFGAEEDNLGVFTTTELLTTGIKINSFGEGEDGEIYFITYFPGEQSLYHITSTTSQSNMITIESDLSFTLPDAIYRSMSEDITLWAKFNFFENPDSILLWELADYGTAISAGNPITIESDFSFSFDARYSSPVGDMDLRVNFNFFGEQDGRLFWELDSYYTVE